MPLFLLQLPLKVFKLGQGKHYYSFFFLNICPLTFILYRCVLTSTRILFPRDGPALKLNKNKNRQLQKIKRHKRNDEHGIFIDPLSLPFVNFPWVYWLSREAINKLVISVYPSRCCCKKTWWKPEQKREREKCVEGRVHDAAYFFFHPRACRFTINSCCHIRGVVSR